MNKKYYPNTLPVFCLLFLLASAPLLLKGQVVTSEVTVEENVTTTVEDDLKIQGGAEVTGNTRLGSSATPRTKLDVGGSMVIDGKATISGTLEQGPYGEYWFWKTYSKSFSGQATSGTANEIVASGFIKHGYGFKVQVRFSNNSNWNHNMYLEAVGVCRNSAFSGSEIIKTLTTSATNGTTGEITSVNFQIQADGSGCKILATPTLRNTSGTLLYVGKVETM